MRSYVPLMLAALTAITATSVRAEDNAAVYVVSYIEIIPAQRDQAAAALRDFAVAIPLERGLIRFDLLQRTSPSHHFLMLEHWQNQKALDEHASHANTLTLQARLNPMLMAPIDERPSIASFVAQIPRIHPNGSIHVVTHVDVPPAARDKIIGPLQTLADRSRKEKGNRRFDVLQQKSRANHFTVVEAWLDRSAGAAHELAPHTREFRATLVPLTGALYDQRWYTWMSPVPGR